jgi:hypothetical protein
LRIRKVWKGTGVGTEKNGGGNGKEKMECMEKENIP